MGTANIVYGYVGATRKQCNAPLLAPTAKENLTTSGTSAPSVNAAPTDHGDGRDIAVRILVSEDGYVEIDGAAVVGDILAKANVELYLSLAPGQRVHIIDAA